MKIYENASKPDNVVILVLEKGEAKHVLKAFKLATEANKKLKVIKKMYKYLYDYLPLY